MIHYGSNGTAECGAEDFPSTDMTLVAADVTCPTCRGWLPIVAPKCQRPDGDTSAGVAELQHDFEAWKARRPEVCINCGRSVAEMRCSYGPPGGTEVGPFCETCYATIKAHEEPADRRHPAVPVAALRALLEQYRQADQGDYAWRAFDLLKDLAALCDAQERT